MTSVAAIPAADVPAVVAPAPEDLPQVGAGGQGAAAPEVGMICSIDEEISADQEAQEAPALVNQRNSRGRSIGSGLRLPSIFHRRTRDSRSMHSSQEHEDSDDEEFEIEKEPWCNFMRQHCGKGKGGCCYWCYVLVFFSFVFFFALFLKFMMTAPMPPENWNMEFERFPALMNQSWVQDAQASQGYSMKMSEIPQTWSGCNHTCGHMGPLLSQPASLRKLHTCCYHSLSHLLLEYLAWPETSMLSSLEEPCSLSSFSVRDYACSPLLQSPS